LVTLPAGAKLAFDGHVTSSTSSTRWFVSPPLETGSNYKYELRAELVRDGMRSVVTRTVLVRANQETRVSLNFADAQVAVRR
jgi:uncharacterized protein (TIGR03000 family)